MKKGTRTFRRIISAILIVALLVAYLPTFTFAEAPEDAPFYDRTVDTNTMDNWQNYFDINKYGTANAGGVWTDKSVFTSADAFGGKVTMLDDTKNFLTALSTVAANKEVVGYSTVPTDTIFVLDLSTSMSSSDVRDLVDATNDAIKKLQGENQNNRIGVVLYSGQTSYNSSVTRLLPLDRYTTTRNDGKYINYSNSTVSVYNEVSGTKSFTKTSRRTGNYTYIQAGLWEAWKMFEAVPDDELVIGPNNWQSGDRRMPIVVLMTDGAPTYGTNNFDNVGDANFGSSYPYNLKAGDAFFVQLTAAYIKSRIENKYQVKAEDGAGRSLFYTLGFNISASSNPNTVNDDNIAYSVVNPDGTTSTDAFWNTYNTAGSVQVTVTGNRQGSSKSVTATKNSYATSKSYVDEYFAASGTGLTAAFDDIVQEIFLQSRYYPTHLEGGSPEFSGYVEFTDTLGEYMEVKNINGILLGDTLYTGQMMASKISSNAEDGLGTVENPTALGNEFIKAVVTRLGISNTTDAQLLVAKAFADGQLRYNGANDWSNYIAWYAYSDGTYAGFYDKDGTEPIPAGAAYINRSYGFLGETSGSIKNSDMMYMSVQVRTELATGRQTVIWKVPAALVPMITYKVTLKGTNVEMASDVKITMEEASPVRLIYETGLRSDLNEFNITKISGENISSATTVNDERHIAADGFTRLFWNNSFNITGDDHDLHKVAIAEFTPNKDNERFYYTFDSAVFKKVGNGYEVVAEGELEANGEYYRRRYNFVNYSASTPAADRVPVFEYERISKASIAAAVWKDNFELLDHNVTGAYVVPKGTPARELQMFDEQKAENKTSSAHMVFHPYVSEQNNTLYVDMNLGNNGILAVTPATGIKISKTIDIYETGTSDTFKFRVTINGNGSYDAWTTALDQTPSGNGVTATFTNGVYEFELKKDQTMWISGLPAGTVYSVEEISDNDDYKIKSVHVNGVAQGKVAQGTVTGNFIDDIDFVNTAVGEGDLVITKKVIDKNGNEIAVNDSVTFTAEVTLKDSDSEAVSGAYQTSKGSITVGANGKFTVTLKAGESFVVRGIPEETKYTVQETNIPNGFALNTAKSTLTGEVDASANDIALIVNDYVPTSTDGDDVTVTVTKTISGGRTSWLAGESYSFTLEQIGGEVIGRVTIAQADAQKSKNISLSTETYTEEGTYYYRITETVGTQGGITYDTANREFSVVVADADKDGDLEITAVNNIANTTVSGKWVVSANFNNRYAATGSDSVTINVQKSINDNYSLAGFIFALYDEDPKNSSEASELYRSALTNAAGETSIKLTFAANMVGQVYTYYLAEVEGNNPNVTYTDKVYKVEVTVTDNLDGTISADAKVYDGATEVTAAEIPFANVYTPSSSDYVTFTGTKVISTNNRALNEGEFTFKLEAIGGAPVPASLTAKNLANGSFSFAPIEFTAAGEYKYVITEDATNKIGGFTYDDARYEITVTVTDAAAALTAEITRFVKVKGASETAVTDIVFENEYSTTPATVKLSGSKLLTGKTIRGGEFSFEIKAARNAPAAPVGTVVNDANGSIDFGAITFTQPGTFVYEITEVNGGETGFIYDSSAYKVTVVVTDNSEGLLYANYTIEKNGMASNEIVFRNLFTPTAYTYDIDLEIGINKTLDGRELAEGEFEFVLINAISGEQIGEAVENSADGKINFPELTLSEVGTYHYKVVELVGDKAGVTYDTDVYHVVLAIAQIDDAASANDGQFELVREELHRATVVIDESTGVPAPTTAFENITGEEITFVNTYAPAPSKIGLGGSKTLVGKELAEGEFTFNLYLAQFDDEKWVKADLVEQVTNDADGNFFFSELLAEEPAEFVYFITEDATNPAENVTYDTAEYMVVVKSTDMLDGTLSLTYEYTVNGEAVEAVEFVNTYTEPPVEPEPPKTGDNRNLGLWFALLLLSGAGIVTLTYFDKRKKA